MADFFASFNLGAQTADPPQDSTCDSIDDLQFRLRRILDEKVTPKRAEHVSTTLEFRATTQFTITLPEPENGAIEGLNNIDPSLGGAPAATTPEAQNERQVSRVIGAHEALMNQPRDNPIIQRSLAKYIVNSLSAIDGSTWAVREVSFGNQGWTFTYLCKESYKQWSRAHAKASVKAIVGEYSRREPDPVLSSRPAFDCRGSVTIAFNKDSRIITIKYDHTPLHKTVAELSEYFKPPPRQLGPGAEKQAQQQKTPRKSKAGGRAQDENGNRRKRTRNNVVNKGAAPMAMMEDLVLQGPPESAMTEHDGPETAHGQAIQALAQIQDADQQGADSGQDAQPFSDYPQQLIDGGASALTAQAGAPTRGSQPPPGVVFPVNITPVEAARRRDAAVAMLSGAGVPPDSLSAEQFSIFSNQSPELQKESLNMLIKYGAERLRIVHPSAKEGAASNQTNSTPTPGINSQSVSSQPTTSKELVPQSGDNGYASAPEAATDHARSLVKPRRKMGKSRNACFPCKERRVKCPRERPICSECQKEGKICEYAPQKSRKKKNKSGADAVETEAEEDQEEGAGEIEADEDAGTYESNHGDSVQNLTHEYSSYPHTSLEDTSALNTGAANQTLHEAQHDHLQPRSNLPLRPDDSGTVAPHHVLADPSRHTRPQAVSADTDSISSTQGSWVGSNPTPHARRSLPSGPGHTEHQPSSFENNQPSSDGSARARYGAQVTAAASALEQLPHSGNRTSQVVNHYRTVEHHDIRDGLRQASALSQAALHQSPTAAAASISAQARSSPFHATNAPRASSRQSQRSQSRNQPNAVYPPPPDPAGHPRANSSANQSSDRDNGAPKYGGQDHYGANIMAGHQATRGSGGYEPYSQSRGTSLTTPTAQPASSTTPYWTSSNHWSESQAGNDRDHGSASNYKPQSTYAQASTSNTGSHSRQTQDTLDRSQSARSGSGSFGQQQQSYSLYPPPPQPQQSERTSQPPGWYNFSNSNANSFTSTNNLSGYSWS